MQRKDLSNTAKQELFKWLEEEEQQLSRRLNQRAQELLKSSQKRQSPNQNNRRKPRKEGEDFLHKKLNSKNKDTEDSTHQKHRTREPSGYQRNTTLRNTKSSNHKEENYHRTRNTGQNTNNQTPIAQGATALTSGEKHSRKEDHKRSLRAVAQTATVSKITASKNT